MKEVKDSIKKDLRVMAKLEDKMWPRSAVFLSSAKDFCKKYNIWQIQK